MVLPAKKAELKPGELTLNILYLGIRNVKKIGHHVKQTCRFAGSILGLLVCLLKSGKGVLSRWPRRLASLLGKVEGATAPNPSNPTQGPVGT